MNTTTDPPEGKSLSVKDVCYCFMSWNKIYLLFRNMMEIGLAAASTLKKRWKSLKKKKKENCSIFGLMKKSVQLRHLYPPFNAVWWFNYSMQIGIGQTELILGGF